MNKYINLVTDEFILDFLHKKLNRFGYYKDFFIKRNKQGVSVTFTNAHDYKIEVLFTDYYIIAAPTSVKAQQKNWQIALTKKFGYEYLNDLKEELSEVIRKEQIHKTSKMLEQINTIEEMAMEK